MGEDAVARRQVYLKNAVDPEPIAVTALQSNEQDAGSILFRLSDCEDKNSINRVSDAV
jgi:hypothetical protein